MTDESIFHEIYGAYYQAVAEMINKALEGTLSESDVREIISRHAFQESPYLLTNAIRCNRYYTILRKSLKSGGYETSISNKPQLPLSLLEKRWLKTISEDPRVKLFDNKFPDLADVEPLYDNNAIYYCGQYFLGDDYNSEEYISNFKKIFSATKEKHLLYIKFRSPRDGIIEDIFEPSSLQYSTKENRFRLFAFLNETDILYTINLSRIMECEIREKFKIPTKVRDDYSYVEVILKEDRQALDRFLLYFSNYERHTRKLDNGKFLIKVLFPRADESEVFINVMSFIPMAKIIAPENMRDKFISRLLKQREILRERIK